MFSRTTTINLDISDFCLKAARLSGRSHGVMLERVRRIAVPPGVIQKGRIIDRDSVAGLVRRIVLDVGGSVVRRLGRLGVVEVAAED